MRRKKRDRAGAAVQAPILTWIALVLMTEYFWYAPSYGTGRNFAGVEIMLSRALLVYLNCELDIYIMSQGALDLLKVKISSRYVLTVS